ncbi:NAD(P)H-dependent oxidoreductase [Lentzea sp. NPDC051208]|uniref:NADPH-dependent FMN reductase n=1 Tax=Lentzea sp. NPDC051208 TaxID=3154642 RepID=UPI0034157371
MTAIGVLVGNPRPASRTLRAALAVREALRQVLKDPVAGATVDAAEILHQVFDPGRMRVVLEELGRSDVLVIATPTYKATYTGLLKAVLDQAPPNWLRGKAVVPVQVAASERHALAVEVHLRPLVVELGGQVPGRGLFLTESALAVDGDALTAALLEMIDADALNAVVAA